MTIRGCSNQMKFDVKIDPLNLDQTLGCGQTFRWRPHGNDTWAGPIADQFFTLRRDGPVLHVEATPGGSRARQLILSHLRAEDDVREIQKVLSRDPVIATGIAHMRGLRIVKIDEWETLASFILATYANIPRIMKMVETLASRFGEPIVEGVNSFPTLDRIRDASRSDLEKCGFGYRARYIHKVSRLLDDNRISLMKELPYSELRGELIELPGVGDKVADCVSLFGFGKLDAFPIDVWMERAMARLYRRRGSYSRLRTFAHERFGAYAGYAQEYIYHNERMRARNGECVFTNRYTTV